MNRAEIVMTLSVLLAALLAWAHLLTVLSASLAPPLLA